MATTVGMTSQAKIASPMGSPPVTEVKSPVRPTNPKPADAGVPVMVKSGTNRPVAAEVATIGT